SVPSTLYFLPIISPAPMTLSLWESKLSAFQIPVGSFNETSGGTMVILKSNLYDSSPSTTNQRLHDKVYETPSLRSPDPYPDGHDGLVASRRLRENDANRIILSDLCTMVRTKIRRR